MGDILTAVGKLVDDQYEEAAEEDQRKRFISLKQKVTAVVRITHAFKKIREERETLVKAGSISPKGLTLPTTLSDSQNPTETLSKSLQSFEGVRSIDLPNEHLPPTSSVLVAPSVPSHLSLKRHISRDDILRKKKSLPKIPESEMFSLSQSAPVITEDKV